MIIIALVAAWSSLVGPLVVSSPESVPQRRAGECQLLISGRDVGEFADADNALRLDVNDVVQIDALSLQPTTVTNISFVLPVGPSVPVRTFRHQSAQRFSESLRIADISDIGVGWYHIEIRSGSCDAAFWVRVYGRSPLTTVIGIGAMVVLVLGISLVVVAMLRARRRGSSRWWGVAAGLLVGLALCVLAQEFSIVAFTPVALALFVGGGAATGGGAAVAGSATAGGGAVGSAPSGGLPSPSPPNAPLRML